MAIAPIMMNWAFWGISDDKFSGIANSFQSVKKLEVRKNPSYVRLQERAFADDITGTFNSLIKCFLTVSNRDCLWFWHNWKIWRSAWSTASWVNCATVSVQINWCAEFDWYVYRSTPSKLYRIAVASITSSWWAQTSWQTFSIGNDDMHPMFFSEAYLFIGDWYYLASVWLSSVWKADQLVLSKDDYIRGITASWSVINIYTSILYFDAWRVYKRQLLSPTPVSKQNFKFYIRWVVQKDAVDYIIAWKKPVLCYFPYLRQILKRPVALSDNHYAYTEHNWYIMMWTPGGVYSWGSLSKDYPESLVMDYIVSPVAGVEEIGAIHSWNIAMYISRKNWFTYGIDLVTDFNYGVWDLPITRYATSGELVTRVYSGAQRFHYKTTDEFVLTFKPLATGESIVLSVAPDFSSTYSVVATIDNTVTTLWRFNVPFSKQFQFLETKITLNWPGTTTPELYEAFYRFSEWG